MPEMPAQASTQAEQQRAAIAVLRDYDLRAKTQAQQQNQRDHSAWYGLQTKLGKRLLLIPQTQLVEVLPPPSVTAIPGTPPWLLGLANHYGRLLTVIDLYAYFYHKCWPQNISSRVLVTNTEPSIGLLVNAVGQPVRCQQPDENISSHQDDPINPWLTGFTHWQQQQLPVLNLPPLVKALSQWKRES